MRLAIWLLFCGFFGSPALYAQQLQVTGEGGGRAQRVVEEILARGRYQFLDRDTILPEDFRAEGDLLIVGADVRLEGEVRGDVGVVSAVFFIRPGARVGGTIASLGGEVYPSGLAQIGEIVAEERGTTVALGLQSAVADSSATPSGNGTDPVTAGGRYHLRVEPRPSDPKLFLPGLFGLRLPTYDRVSGLTLAWGPEWRLTGDEEGPIFAGWATYHSARGSLGGGGEAELPLGAGLRLQLQAARATVTNDAWIRGDLPNTLASLSYASDLRDYRETDLGQLTIGIPDDTPLIPGEAAFSPRVSLLWARDRTLHSRDPWSLFGGADDWRLNPAIAPGTIVSAALGGELRWQGNSTAFLGDVELERTLPELGDFDYTRWRIDGLWEMEALWQHQIRVYIHAIGTFGDDPAPPQRWSFVGGLNTLPTYDAAEFRGDRLFFVRSTYGIPLNFAILPIIGVPTFQIDHTAGMAWVGGGTSPAWRQNLGFGLSALLLRAQLFIDPSGETDPTVAAGFVLPAF